MDDAPLALDIIHDHAERMVSLALSQDRYAPRLSALLKALGDGAQELEDLCADLLMATDVDTATGALLTRIGELVGEARGPLRDAEYRGVVRARIRINACKGSVDELIAIFGVLTAPSDVQYIALAPNGIYLQARRQSWMPERQRRRVARMMDLVRPIGRSMMLVECLPQPFGYVGAEFSTLGYDRAMWARSI